MKYYIRQQRFSRIINIKELNNLLNLDDNEKEKDINGNIEPIIENCNKKETIFKIKTSKKKVKKKKNIPMRNESVTSSMQSGYLMNKKN